MKKVWKIFADIHQNTIFMMSYPLQYFFEVWPKIGLGGYLKEYFTHFKGDFSVMIYPEDEFNKQAEFMAKKMLKNPVWAHHILKRVEESAAEFFVEMRRFKKLPVKKMSNQEIIRLINQVKKNHLISHGLGASLSWHADAEKEIFTKGLMKMVAAKIEQANIKKSLPEVFAIVTTPTKESLMEKEEKNFLAIAKAIESKRKIKETFIQSDLDSLAANLKSIDGQISRLIQKHYQTYTPFTFQYHGPAYPLSDYLGRWQAFFREGNKPEKMLRQIIDCCQKSLKAQRSLIGKLKLNKYERDLIRLAQFMVYIKDYRKNALYNAMYYYEILFKEVARRLGISLNQLWTMKPWEIIIAIKTGKVNVDELNQRQIEAVDYWYKKAGKSYNVIYTGSKAKEFLKKIRMKKNRQQSNELTGTCAYPGKVTGVVKIVNLPAEMAKMKKGDIMVAHNTNPNLVSAMKKAAALISGAGGLTCHTAIVAREMKVPCVVGVADCDKILKNGDRVEVDATKGIVRKL